MEIEYTCIEKIRETESQTKLNMKERMKNLHGAFKIVNKEKVWGRNIIIIDDVITTGSTVYEISAALKLAGARKVIALSFAH